MLNKILIMLTALLIAEAVAAPASADLTCGERVPMTQQLETVHKEVQQAVGLSSGGGVIEVFASASGSWTVLMTYPSGVTCVVATGEAWEQLPTKVVGPTA